MTQHSDEIPATGAVFTFGKSRFADNEPSHFFIKNDPVVSISCGDEHSAVICQQGRVFVFGGNSYGQLGLGHTDDVTRPSCVKWLKPQKAIFVACGLGHTVFVTDTYAIYTVGNNSDGQLGTGNTESQCVPQYVDLETDDVRVKQVSAGSSHTVILTENGRVFVCGSNTEGQLGLGDDIKMVISLTEVKFMETISSIECGYYHTVFITEKGVVFVTGENDDRKLGIRGAASQIFVPQVLPMSTPIKSACCGASHTFLLSADETKVFALGSNEQGQLGLPKAVVDVPMPTELPIDKMFEGNQLKMVSCGAFHTAFVTDNGFLYTCGEARHNKLCLDRLDNMQGVDDTMPNQYTPKRVTAMGGYMVDNVACGGCHTIMTAIKSEQSGTDKENSAVPFQLPPLQKAPLKNEINKSENGMMSLPAENEIAKMAEDVDGKMNEEIKNISDAGEAMHNGIEAMAKDAGDSLAEGVRSIKESVTDVKDKLEDVGDNLKNKVENIGSTVKDKIETVGDIAKDKVNEAVKGVEKLKDDLGEKTSTAIESLKGQVQSTLHATDQLTEDAKGVLGIPDKMVEATNSPPPKSPTLKNLLQLPEQSPDLSQKSEATTENETIICESDKSSIVDGKTKTQAVMPIVRSEDGMSDAEDDRLGQKDENEVVEGRKESRGPFARFMQTLRDKENSCMGRSKVIENTVVENVNKGMTTAEETVHKVEETIVHEIHNQTSSRTCAIL